MKTKAKKRVFEYYALKYAQRGNGAPAFLVFHAPAADLIAWADVDRLQPTNRRGAQRPLRELKVNKVARFLKLDARNTIPTSVVVAVDLKAVSFSGGSSKSATNEHGPLRISMSGNDKPGLIIDGQHRAFGIAKFSPSTHINVVAILGGDDAERAFQFVVINNSASRINRDHIKALNLNYDKEKLNTRLISSSGVSLGLRDDKYDDLQAVDGMAPFKGMLKWPTNKAGFIPPNAIESALAETHDRAALLGIEELELDVFLAIWSKIKALRGNVWNAESHLLQKVSIYALTVYVLDSMVASQRNADEPIDFTEEETLNSLVVRVVKRIPEDFWIAEWTGKELDTSSGRQRLVEALQVIDSNSRFGRTWYDNVSLIDPALLAGQNYGGKPKSGKKVAATKQMKKTARRKQVAGSKKGTKKVAKRRSHAK